MIDLNIVIPIASSGIVGAIIGSKISTELNVFLLKKFFRFFLGCNCNKRNIFINKRE